MFTYILLLLLIYLCQLYTNVFISVLLNNIVTVLYVICVYMVRE